jgi:1,4-dihydroxy-2-naphthoyl-CoA synthase
MSSPASAWKFENVLYENKGPIAYVTFNRPKVLNALNKGLLAELKSAFEDSRDDSVVRGVILTDPVTKRSLPARISLKLPTTLRSKQKRKHDTAKPSLT